MKYINTILDFPWKDILNTLMMLSLSFALGIILTLVLVIKLNLLSTNQDKPKYKVVVKNYKLGDIRNKCIKSGPTIEHIEQYKGTVYVRKEKTCLKQQRQIYKKPNWNKIIP